MSALDFAPAAALGLFVTAAVAAADLWPIGGATVLVHLADAAPEAALVAASLADAALVSIPQPGFALLHGDAGRIRGALGLAVLWRGTASCSTRL